MFTLFPTCFFSSGGDERRQKGGEPPEGQAGRGVGELPTAWRVCALGAGILIKTDKRKMHVNVHFNWLLVRIAGDIKQRDKRGNEIKSFQAFMR